MKKIVMIAAMMVAAVSANAQFDAGTFSIQPKLGGVGAMLSNVPKLDFGDGLKLDKTAMGGALIGAEFEYQLTDMFSMAAGVNYSMQGSAWKDDNVLLGGVKYKIKDTKVELGYINVPVVVNAYLFRGFAVKTGVQFGFLVSANMKASFSAESDVVNQTVNYDMKIKDECKKFDVSIPVGVSYQFKVPIVIDARYNIGLTNVGKDADESIKNQVFQLTVGYKFKL